MSEIEKMYANAGVEKEVIPCPAKYYGYNCTRNNWDDADCSCDIEGYPKFTAEKQIELIKWLAKRLDFGLEYYQDKTWSVQTQLGWDGYEYQHEHKNFDEALAGLINTLWQDLTETEKAEIKRILE